MRNVLKIIYVLTRTIYNGLILNNYVKCNVLFKYFYYFEINIVNTNNV